MKLKPAKYAWYTPWYCSYSWEIVTRHGTYNTSIGSYTDPSISYSASSQATHFVVSSHVLKNGPQELLQLLTPIQQSLASVELMQVWHLLRLGRWTAEIHVSRDEILSPVDFIKYIQHPVCSSLSWHVTCSSECRCDGLLIRRCTNIPLVTNENIADHRSKIDRVVAVAATTGGWLWWKE